MGRWRGHLEDVHHDAVFRAHVTRAIGWALGVENGAHCLRPAGERLRRDVSSDLSIE